MKTKLFKVEYIENVANEYREYITVIQAKNMKNAVEQFIEYNPNIEFISKLYETGYLVDKNWNEYVFTQLGNKKFKMTFEERKEYFSKCREDDLGVYLMRALDRITELEENLDYVAILGELGMTHSEALEVLDGYGEDKGWQKDE